MEKETKIHKNKGNKPQLPLPKVFTFFEIEMWDKCMLNVAWCDPVEIATDYVRGDLYTAKVQDICLKFEHYKKFIALLRHSELEKAVCVSNSECGHFSIILIVFYNFYSLGQ
jgi:hypothetical protein